MSSNLHLSITVTNPIIQKDNYGAYVSYSINVITNNPSFQHGNISVVRRFSDFEWLSKELAKSFPGLIIPPLPEKQSLGRFTEDFLESRRRSLQTFLHRVAKHPLLCEAAPFFTLLQGEEYELTKAKLDSSEKAPSKATSWFGNTFNQALNSGKVTIDRTQDDSVIDDISSQVAILEKILTSIFACCSTLVKTTRESAHLTYGFGLSLIELKTVEEPSELSNIIDMFSNSSQKAALAGVYQADAQCAYLELPFEEYLRFTNSIKETLERRKNKREDYINVRTELAVKESDYNKALCKENQESLQQQKQLLVVRAQTLVDNAKDVLDEVSANIIAEYENFNKTKLQEFKLILNNFINIQIDFHKKAQEVWSVSLNSLNKRVAGTKYNPEVVDFSAKNPNAMEGDNFSSNEEKQKSNSSTNILLEKEIISSSNDVDLSEDV